MLKYRVIIVRYTPGFVGGKRIMEKLKAIIGMMLWWIAIENKWEWPTSIMALVITIYILLVIRYIYLVINRNQSE
jgi:hypothetical protein